MRFPWRRWLPTSALLLLSMCSHQRSAQARHPKIQDNVQTLWNCGPDIVMHCGDVKPGGGRMADCLHAKRRLMTNMCTDRRTSPDHTPPACKPDAAELCREGIGDSALQLICLRKYKELVSEKCWVKLEKVGTHGWEVLPNKFKQMGVDSNCTMTLLKHCGCPPTIPPYTPWHKSTIGVSANAAESRGVNMRESSHLIAQSHPTNPETQPPNSEPQTRNPKP